MEPRNSFIAAQSSNQVRCLIFIFLGVRGANGAWDGLELSHIIEWKPHGTLGRPQQLKCNVRTERGKSGGRQGSRRWCAGGNWWETCQLDGCDCGVSRKGQRRGIYRYFSYLFFLYLTLTLTCLFPVSRWIQPPESPERSVCDSSRKLFYTKWAKPLLTAN